MGGWGGTVGCVWDVGVGGGGEGAETHVGGDGGDGVGRWVGGRVGGGVNEGGGGGTQSGGGRKIEWA